MTTNPNPLRDSPERQVKAIRFFIVAQPGFHTGTESVFLNNAKIHVVSKKYYAMSQLFGVFKNNAVNKMPPPKNNAAGP